MTSAWSWGVEKTPLAETKMCDDILPSVICHIMYVTILGAQRTALTLHPSDPTT